MSEQKTNVEKLADMLEFDPAKRPTLTQDVFSEVLKEIKEERAKVAKTQGKELIVKAMALRESMAKAKKTFEAEYNKNEKELGKIINQIQSNLSGKAPDETQECEEKKESCPNS